MKTLNNVKEMVKRIMVDYPETRDNDDLLYLAVMEDMGMSTDAPIRHVLKHRRVFGLPTFETVRRSRQKAQEENPELRGTRAADRADAEEVFRAFARGES